MNHRQKNFVVGFKIANGKFKNLNELIVILGEKMKKLLYPLLCGKNIVLQLPRTLDPGGSTAIYWLYGYVPLERVWHSSHLVCYRV